MFKEAGLVINETKCHLNQKEVIVLGFTISRKHIEPARANVSELFYIPRPWTQIALMRFICVVVSYQWMIPHLSATLGPHHDLVGSSKLNFHWSNIHEETFNAAKNKLQKVTVLSTPHPNETFILYWCFGSCGGQ